MLSQKFPILSLCPAPLPTHSHFLTLYHLGQAGLVGKLQAVGHMVDHDGGTALGRQGVVGVDTVLVLGEEGGVGEFADVMIKRSGTHKLHIGADTGCGVAGEVANGYGVLECARTFIREPHEQGGVDVGKLYEGDNGDEAE